MADRSSEAVCVGFVHGREVAYSWHASMVELLGHDLAHHQRVLRGGWLGVRYGTGGIIAARNEVAARFLEDGRAEWLWWIDTDMGFAPDTVDRLVYHADPVARPVVGALCFAHHETGLDGMGGYRAQPLPTLYQWRQVAGGQEGFSPWLDYPRDSMLQVAGTGSACLLIHRSALEAVAETSPGDWYTPVPNTSTGKVLSEDLSFCVRLGAAGIPVHVHTGIKTTHLKDVWLSEADYDRLVLAAAARPGPAPVDDGVEPVGPAMPA